MAKFTVANRFGIIPNKLLNDPKITLKAKGLFGYLQSKPENWDFSADRIKFDTKESRDAILSGLKELENFGYLQRKKYQNKKGFWEIEYILFDTPNLENPKKEEPKKENPTQENPTTNKKRNTKKEIIKKEINKSCAKINFAPFFENIVDLFIKKQLENGNPKFLYLYNKPNFEKIKEKWIAAAEKLKRLDGFSEKQIAFIVNYLFTDDFWKEQIISFEKLRKKNKDGIPYFVVLVEKAKNQYKNQKKTFSDYTF